MNEICQDRRRFGGEVSDFGRWGTRALVWLLLALTCSPAWAQTTVTNTATVAPPAGITDSSGGCDAGQSVCKGNNTASRTSAVVVPVLELTKSASPSSFTVGVAGSYTLTLTNNGTAATPAVSTITDSLPAGLTLGTLPPDCAASGQVVTCTVPAGLVASGGTSESPRVQ